VCVSLVKPRLITLRYPVLSLEFSLRSHRNGGNTYPRRPSATHIHPSTEIDRQNDGVFTTRIKRGKTSHWLVNRNTTGSPHLSLCTRGLYLR
jgi:hypothetical protein